MRKYAIKIVLVLTICTTCIVSFSYTTKAATITPVATNIYGSYYAETYYGNGSQVGSISVGIPPFTVELPMADRTVFHYHIDFNDTYSGEITILLSTSTSYKLEDCYLGVNGGWFYSVPSLTAVTTGKTIKIHLSNQTSLDFYITGPEITNPLNPQPFTDTMSYNITYDLHTEYDVLYYAESLDDRLFNVFNELQFQSDLINGMYQYIDDIESKLGTISTTLNNLADYQVNMESLMAYLYCMSTSSIKVQMVNGGTYPYITTITSTPTRIVRMYPNDVLYFYFYTNSNTLTVTSSNQNVTVQYETVPPIMSGYRLRRVTLRYVGNDSNGETFTLSWNESKNVIPVYFGTGDDMSQEMQSVTHHDSDTKTTNILQQILTTLGVIAVQYVDPTDEQTYNDTMNQVSLFLTNIRNSIPQDTEFQNDANLIDVSTFSSASTVVDVFATSFLQNVPIMGTLVILGLFTFIIKVFLI